MRTLRSLLLPFLLLAFLLLAPLAASHASAHAASGADDPPKHEFRGAWISTVLRLDWPRTTASIRQQGDLVVMLDALKAAGINAVFFQVRSEADAMYASELEPWSYWLTGVQGQAPEPFYDPLAFAVEEAHKRGMELHAWLNPFRADRDTDDYAVDPAHVTAAHPDWILSFDLTQTAGSGDSLRLLDPGLPAVRDYVARVVADVVRRYDVDGIHFDDYFYPYPPNEIDDEDDPTFAAHPNGFTDRADWRRDNIDRLIAQVADSIRALKPYVKFGISPFGIWRSGVPPGITGLSAYDVIYADAPNWVYEQTVDYLAPQLYWPFGGGQDYARLSAWWASVAFGRHLYVGHALYRADPVTATGTLYAASEVPRQIRYNRGDPGIQGSVFFRAENLTRLSSQGIVDSLRADLYRYPALTPTMPWKDVTPPAAPRDLAFAWTDAGEVLLEWQPPAPEAGVPAPRRYTVYRVRAAAPPAFETVAADARNLLAVTGEPRLADRPEQAAEPYHYYVASVSANAVESTSAPSVSLEGRAVAVEAPPAASVFALHPGYPNPFAASTAIAFTLDRPALVSLRVYDLLGRRVATLVGGRPYDRGTSVVQWDGTNDAGQPVAGGTYLYQLEADGQRRTRLLVRVD